MNDFTKEELIIIRNNLSVESSPYLSERIKDIYGKISLMIDNYCEHESDGNQYIPNLYKKLIIGAVITEKDKEVYLKCKNCKAYFK